MKYIFQTIMMIIAISLHGQGLRTEGKKIVNKHGEEVLLRGIGPGGWQVMEGYMMQTSGVAGAQHEIRENLIDLMGEEKTNEFFAAWLATHFTKEDVDSMAAWGYNSIRIPMHYNLFTLPIEAEPVPGENTWIETGFQLIDSVLKWSRPHNIYVILDLHAAPGGQGTGSEINDYDPDKPSLWESEENKDKTVELWRRIAERYKDEEWIGGYDLINEPHWNLPGGVALRELYGRITDAVRSVDTTHILYIEGNWYANDFTGLTPPWDDNMVYSFHKYWSTNKPGDLDWVLPLRDQHNIPLWMGESGENSNTWFTDAISLFENNNIGWAWWTVRKIGDIDSPYAVDINPGYEKIRQYWYGEGPRPTAEETYEGMINLVENLRVANSRYRKDVPDACIRQVQTDETKPFTRHTIPGQIDASDYDLGKNGYAYFDTQVADYNLSTGTFQPWNSGWSYRNDGVDIERSQDPMSNGFNVGFTEKGEWMKYTVNVAESGVYRITTRVATESSDTKIHFTINDQSVTPSVDVPRTGGWQTYEELVIEDVLLEGGMHGLKIHFDAGSLNLTNFTFEKTGEIDNPDFQILTGEIGEDGQSIDLNANLSFASDAITGAESLFEVKVLGNTVNVTGITAMSDKVVSLDIDRSIFYTDDVLVSYTGNSVVSDADTPLQTFTDLEVINKVDPSVLLPDIIQAENFDEQQGFGLEETTDLGGGLNIGFSDIGDYADYKIFNREMADFKISLRLAGQDQAGSIGLYLLGEDGVENELVVIETPRTGGWQTWETVSEVVEVPEGAYTLRLRVLSPGFNLNWINIQSFILGGLDQQVSKVSIFPNPTTKYVQIEGEIYHRYMLYGQDGRKVLDGYIDGDNKIDLSNQESGLYFLKLYNEHTHKVHGQRLIIND